MQRVHIGLMFDGLPVSEHGLQPVLYDGTGADRHIRIGLLLGSSSGCVSIPHRIGAERAERSFHAFQIQPI